jgi:hypothetical protein
MTLVNSLLADIHVASPDWSSCLEESAWFRGTGGVTSASIVHREKMRRLKNAVAQQQQQIKT